MSLTDQNRLAEFILETTYPTKKKSSRLVGLIHVFFGFFIVSSVTYPYSIQYHLLISFLQL